MTSPGQNWLTEDTTKDTSLFLFAQQLATRLGPAWAASARRSPHTTSTVGWDPAEKRCWDRKEGVVSRALRRAVDSERAVLTHPHGFQLYLIERPRRVRQILVAGLLPAGIREFGSVQAPAAISVPRDPARAVATMRNRGVLPRYRLAAARVSRETRFKGVHEVMFGQDFDGSPLVNVLSQHAARLLLHVDSPWLLDPESGLCRPRDPASDAGELVRSAGALLQAFGYRVTVTSGQPWGQALRPPTGPLPLPAPGPPPGRSAGQTR